MKLQLLYNLNSIQFQPSDLLPQKYYASNLYDTIYHAKMMIIPKWDKCQQTEFTQLFLSESISFFFIYWI